jgi:hypothetical protein
MAAAGAVAAFAAASGASATVAAAAINAVIGAMVAYGGAIISGNDNPLQAAAVGAVTGALTGAVAGSMAAGAGGVETAPVTTGTIDAAAPSVTAATDAGASGGVLTTPASAAQPVASGGVSAAPAATPTYAASTGSAAANNMAGATTMAPQESGVLGSVANWSTANPGSASILGNAMSGLSNAWETKMKNDAAEEQQDKNLYAQKVHGLSNLDIRATLPSIGRK